MLDWGGETVGYIPHAKLFPSLLSICKDIPMSIKIIFYKNKYSIRERTKYKQRLEKNIVKYTDNKSPFVTVFEKEYAEYSEWMEKERTVHINMKILFNKWIQKKYKNRLLNTEDPCTLQPPVKCVKIFDFKSRGFYQFEASSLKKQFETALQYSEWLFPKPNHPKNPLTNLDFNEGQRITIVDSLRKYGYGSWFIEAYRSSRWNLTNFSLDNFTNLKINSITQICKNPTGETLEYLDDFIVSQYEDNDINKPIVKIALRWAVKHRLDDAYMKTWLNLMKDYYIIRYRYDIIENSANTNKLNVIYVRSMQLFDNTEKIEEYKTALGAPPPPPPPQSPVEDYTDTESDISNLIDPPPLGNIVYVHNLEINIQDLINDLIQDDDSL